MIYLASPYTHPDREVKLRRVAQTEEAMASFHAQNIVVYSPIVHWHYVAERLGLATDHVPWLVQNEGMMRASREIGLLRIDGWKESRGMRHEWQFAQKHGIPLIAYDLIGSTVVNQGPVDVSELP
jgi:hypothetical protein